jgi:hypothetical protein
MHGLENIVCVSKLIQQSQCALPTSYDHTKRFEAVFGRGSPTLYHAQAPCSCFLNEKFIALIRSLIVRVCVTSYRGLCSS